MKIFYSNILPYTLILFQREKMMKAEKQIVKDVVLLPLEGKLMGGTETNVISHQLEELLKQGFNKIVLDFRKVDWINSLATGSLIKWFFIIKEKGGDLRITNTNRRVHQILTITKIMSVIKTFDNQQEAINSFYCSASC